MAAVNGSSRRINPSKRRVTPSTKWTRRRQTSTPAPKATANTGNKNQSSSRMSGKKSVSMAANKKPQTNSTANTKLTSSALSATTRKLRQEAVNRAA